MMSEANEVQYLVLPDAERPYFLARVRWPDVCQAISPVRPSWQDDPGLFDLPYDPSSVPVTPERAAAIAAEWEARLPAEGETDTSELTLMRRMPADWSNLSPAELRAWSIELTNPRTRAALGEERARARRIAASGSRLLRRRSRRGVPGPSPASAELAHDEMVSGAAGAAGAAPTGETVSTLFLGEEPVSVTGADGAGADGHTRDDDVVIDLTDTTEDAPASVEGA
jgi:hypothetical protein